MYPEHVKNHLESGKALAWGVVPTSTDIRDQTVETLTAQYEKMVDNLVEKSGVDKGLVYQQTILTGSCGTGSMEVPDAEKVFRITGELSKALRATHGF